MKEQFKSALSALSGKLSNWLTTIVDYIPNFILALLILTASYFVARYVSKIVEKLVAKRVEQQSISRTVARIAAVLVVVSGLFLALGIMNLSETLRSLLAGAGIAGLAIGLALQGTLSNTIAGVVLSFRKKIQIGNWVETVGYSGEVMDINLKDFTLKEADNNIVVIPNKTILENPLKNYSLTTKMRVFLECGVGYESDLEQVKELTKTVISETFEQVKSPDDVEFYYKEFGNSSINFLCRFWIDAESLLEKMRAKTQAIIEIKKAYEKAGINIPFPIRTLEFNNKLNVKSPELEHVFSNN